jgi:hypothetical protein
MIGRRDGPPLISRNINRNTYDTQPTSWNPGKTGLRIKGIFKETSIYKSLTPFTNTNKTLYLQLIAASPNAQACNEVYVQLHSPNTQLPYTLKMGPNFCKKSFTLDLSYKNNVFHWRQKQTPPDNRIYNLYTFILYPSNSYELYIDKNLAVDGGLYEHWPMLKSKYIRDPKEVKPPYWEDPENATEYIEPPEYINTNDSQPKDWDELLDGHWAPTLMKNPHYFPKSIIFAMSMKENKGTWQPNLIANFDYYTDTSLYEMSVNGISVHGVVNGEVMVGGLHVSDDAESANKFEWEWARNVDREVHRLREYMSMKEDHTDSIKDEL